MPDGKAATGARGAPRPGGPAPIEAALLLGVQRRDPEALGRFYDAVFGFVYNLAYRLTGNAATAEDVAQEVFLKVHRAAHKLDAERSPYPWLTAITANACRDLARRTRTRAEQPLDETSLERSAGEPGPDEALLRQEEVRLLERALQALDEPQRAVVIMHAYSGCSHDEIAKTLGLTPAAVRKRYSRALETMRVFVRKLTP